MWGWKRWWKKNIMAQQHLFSIDWQCVRCLASGASFSVSVYRFGDGVSGGKRAHIHSTWQKSKAKKKKNEQHAQTKLEKGKEFVCLCFLFLSYRFKNADKKSLHSLTVHAQFYVKLRFTLLMPSLTPSGHAELCLLAFSVGIEQHIWLKKWNKDIGLKGVFFCYKRYSVYCSAHSAVAPNQTILLKFSFLFLFGWRTAAAMRKKKIRINE